MLFAFAAPTFIDTLLLKFFSEQTVNYVIWPFIQIGAVVTAVAVARGARVLSARDRAVVAFRALAATEVDAYVATGEIHYFLAGGMGGGPGRGNSEITQWVQQHFTAQTIGNQTVYDLTAPTS